MYRLAPDHNVQLLGFFHYIFTLMFCKVANLIKKIKFKSPWQITQQVSGEIKHIGKSIKLDNS